MWEIIYFLNRLSYFAPNIKLAVFIKVLEIICTYFD
jgi:hypothetical protein